MAWAAAAAHEGRGQGGPECAAAAAQAISTRTAVLRAAARELQFSSSI